jgi:hypothetical protein
VAVGAAATMTEPRRTDPDAATQELPHPPKRAPKPRIRKPGPLGVVAGSFGLFFAITALLAFQMRRGADPALGAPKPAATQTAAPRQILVRHVIETRIVEHRTRRVRTTPPRSTTASPAPAARTAPAAPSAPAAPPPAPAPAPLTTRSS